MSPKAGLRTPKDHIKLNLPEPERCRGCPAKGHFSADTFHAFPGYKIEKNMHPSDTGYHLLWLSVIPAAEVPHTHTATASFTCSLPPRPYLSLTLRLCFFMLLLRDVRFNSSTWVLPHNLTEKKKKNRWKCINKCQGFSTPPSWRTKKIQSPNLPNWTLITFLVICDCKSATLALLLFT